MGTSTHKGRRLYTPFTVSQLKTDVDPVGCHGGCRQKVKASAGFKVNRSLNPGRRAALRSDTFVYCRTEIHKANLSK